MSEIKLNSVEEAIADFKEGKFVIVVDDEDRENEGDLIAAAEKITPEMVNFMLKHARGVLCVPITLSRCKELNLPHQVNEAAIDLCRMAGLYPAGALMEIMNEDGTMARLPELKVMADKYGMKLISIKDMIAYRLKTESLIEVGQTVDMPTKYGHFQLTPFRQISNGLEHFALTKGEWKDDDEVLVRVHSSCATGDILGSMRCDCGDQLHHSLEMIEKEGRGVLVYMQQEGRGIGLMNKIAAYKLQEQGYDTVDANVHLGFKPDERDYGCGAQMLRHLRVHKMRLITNNPVKRVGLEAYGLEITENVPVEVHPNEYDYKYLKTKQDRMGHDLHLK